MDYLSSFKFGSNNINIGAHRPIVEEPLLIESIHSIKWQESRVNLSELALLRFTHGWSRKQLAEHYGRSEDAIQNYFQKMKKMKLF